MALPITLPGERRTMNQTQSAAPMNDDHVSTNVSRSFRKKELIGGNAHGRVTNNDHVSNAFILGFIFLRETGYIKKVA